jgi:hypothetical protein
LSAKSLLQRIVLRIVTVTSRPSPTESPLVGRAQDAVAESVVGREVRGFDGVPWRRKYAGDPTSAVGTGASRVATSVESRIGEMRTATSKRSFTRSTSRSLRSRSSVTSG